MSDLNQTIYEGYLNWAEDYYARAIAKYPRSAFAYQGRADAYRANNEHEKAIADYTRAIELSPRDPTAYLGRGKSYNALGQLEKARSDLEQAKSVTDKLHLKRQADELLKNL
jgi:tetratricopeptide (TPR) repeat protein